MKKLFVSLLLLLLSNEARAQCANATIAQFNGTTMVCSSTITNVTHTGGTATSLTGLSIRNTAASFDLLFTTNDATQTVNRTLTLNLADGNRTLFLSGNFTNAGGQAVTLTATGSTNVTLPPSGTLAVIGNPLSQFAATTSAQLSGVLSDETGSGLAVFATSPTFTTSFLMGSGFVQNWNAGDVLLTHSANKLDWTGASSGYQFDALVRSTTFRADTAASAYNIGTDVILFVSGNYTAINSPATIGSTLTFGNTGDPTMYINATTINLRTLASASYFTATASLIAVLPTTASTSATTGALTVGGGLGTAGAGWFGTYINTTTNTVNGLPACGAGIKGARTFVNDNATALAFAAVITTGGAIQTPVYCDGTVWRQGANDNFDMKRKYA